MLTACLLGFVLGLRHASDPDHVIAVSAIVARWRRAGAASWIGVAWGLGHSLTLVGVGTAIVALGLSVPARVALSLELVVGVVLVALGLGNLWLARRWSADPERAARTSPAREAGALATPLLRALGVGAVHGLAGSAAVALLALAAMPTPQAAVAYLLVFSLGTVGGMLAVSLGLGLPLGFAARLPGARRWIVAGSGAASLGFGAWLVYEIGVVQGLL